MHDGGNARGGDAGDQAAAAVQYRRAATGYDKHMRRFGRWQQAAVERLDLRPGDTVIDVACGTGLNFPLLADRVGPDGRIIGIDLSPEMLAQARSRIEDSGWENIELIESAIDHAHIRTLADAALFSFTHDVLQSQPSVENVVRHLKPGGRVSSVGAKLAPRWALPVNLVVRRAARPFITTTAGLDAPWRQLDKYTGEMEHESFALGGAYVAWGKVREQPPHSRAPLHRT